MKKILLLTKTLFVVALLCVGQNAWGDVTPFSESYSSTSTTTGWSTGTSGRFDPAILNESDNYFLSVVQANRNNNGATVTGTIISGKAAAGDDFTITFDMRLSSSSNQTNTEFQIKDASNSGNIISLKETGTWATTWTLNGTSTQVTLPNSNKANSSNTIADVTWCSYKITRSGDKTFLTITNKETSAVIFERAAITGSSATGGLGNIVFISSRYLANFAIDNIVVREVEEGDVPDVKYYEITTKYQLSDETQVKADRVESAAEGESYSPVYDVTFDDEDYRYTYVSGANTIASVSEDATITIVYSREALAEHTVNFKTTKDVTRTLASVTVKDAKSYTYAYPRYLADGTTLYQIDKARYDQGFQNTASNVTSDVDRTESYSSVSSNVAFFSEAEDIASLTEVSSGNVPARCSAGNAAYAAEDAVITTLAPGKYTITAAVFGNAGTNFVFKNGETELYTLSTAGYELEGTSEELTFSEETTITLAAVGNGGNSPKVLDYILIKKTGDYTVSKTITSAGYATFCSPYALDFSGVEGLKAYIVTGTEAETTELATTEVTSVPANTGVLLEGSAGDYNIPVIASSATNVTANKLVGVIASEVLTANNGFVLMGSPKVGFYKNNKDFTLTANTAYLPVDFAGGEVTARSAYFFRGDITGVANVEAAAEAVQKDGKFFKNGKLFIFKNGKKFNAAGQIVK